VIFEASLGYIARSCLKKKNWTRVALLFHHWVHWSADGVSVMQKFTHSPGVCDSWSGSRRRPKV
jgi:hypothetical protein